MRLVAEQEAREGDFRYKHCSVRESAEAVAFYRAAPAEERLTNRRLDALISTQTRLVLRQAFVQVSVGVKLSTG